MTAPPIQRIHLDPIGGIAGDMFVAAIADAFPDLIPGLLAEVRKLPAPAGADIRFVAHRDAVLGGRRFHVADNATHAGHAHEQSGHAHARAAHHDEEGHTGHDAGPGHAHDAHTDYADIRRLLHETPLRAPVREHALALFALLAEAESEVHGIKPDDVCFHEVGAWDSIVDFVAAAFMIDALGPAEWSCAPLPLGGGRVRGAHGMLPVPAPATALLMRGMTVVDDGVPGERVTPTGAAILKYLLARKPATRPVTPMSMSVTGNGFGTRQLPGISNVLRCMALAPSKIVLAPSKMALAPSGIAPAAAQSAVSEEELAVATFEIDDQTAEDLSVALERIRQAPGVLDVLQSPVFGKKGRMATQVQILARPEHVDAVAELCFVETSTLGLRLARVSRRLVPRSTLSFDQPELRVKLASRPGGRVTAKAEMDDLAQLPGGKAARDLARRSAESKARKKP